MTIIITYLPKCVGISTQHHLTVYMEFIKIVGKFNLTMATPVSLYFCIGLSEF